MTGIQLQVHVRRHMLVLIPLNLLAVVHVHLTLVTQSRLKSAKQLHYFIDYWEAGY